MSHSRSSNRSVVVLVVVVVDVRFVCLFAMEAHFDAADSSFTMSMSVHESSVNLRQMLYAEQ